MTKTIVFKSSLLLLISLGLILLVPKKALAACPAGAMCGNGCESAGQCSSSGFLCESTSTNGIVIIAQGSKPCGGGAGQSVFGGVHVPYGVMKYQSSGATIGIVNFASVILRLFTIICGLWFMFNMFVAGYLFLYGSSDSAVFNKFKEMLYYSLLGLFVIAIAYLAAGLIGTIFFGDPGFIIRPTLYQATPQP